MVPIFHIEANFISAKLRIHCVFVFKYTLHAKHVYVTLVNTEKFQ